MTYFNSIKSNEHSQALYGQDSQNQRQNFIIACEKKLVYFDLFMTGINELTLHII